MAPQTLGRPHALKNPSMILSKGEPWSIKIYWLNNSSLKTKASRTISTYLCIVKAPTLNLLAIMFALTTCANQYDTNPIFFLGFDGL